MVCLRKRFPSFIFEIVVVNLDLESIVSPIILVNLVDFDHTRLVVSLRKGQYLVLCNQFALLVTEIERDIPQCIVTAHNFPLL